MVYTAVVKRDLDDLHLPGRSTLLQYANDLLIASTSEGACQTDSVLLLQRLAECGYRASLAKVQFCWAEVTYMGHILKDGLSLLAPERVKLLVNMPPPRTNKDMLWFLGMVNYYGCWTFEYAAMDSVLQAAMLQLAPSEVLWTDNMHVAFQDLKHALALAPVLGFARLSSAVPSACTCERRLCYRYPDKRTWFSLSSCGMLLVLTNPCSPLYAGLPKSSCH